MFAQTNAWYGEGLSTNRIKLTKLTIEVQSIEKIDCKPIIVLNNKFGFFFCGGSPAPAGNPGA